MSDLVKRLRNPPFGTETSERNLMREAADEIERLRVVVSGSIACCTEWLRTFGDVEMKHTSAREHATDAVQDILEDILRLSACRKGEKP